MPDLGDVMATARVVLWKKRPGDAVCANEIVVEIQTDKAVVEVESDTAGVLSRIVIDQGGSVENGWTLAIIDEAGGG